MTDESYHDVVGAVICRDPWYRPRILLLKRKTEQEGEKYWPGKWCYLAEHRKPSESDLETIDRGLKEETGLSALLVVRGPMHVEARDPDHHELFKISLYQVVPNHWVPTLGEENADWGWYSQILGFEAYACLNEGSLFPPLRDHLRKLFDFQIGYDWKRRAP